MGPNVSAQVLDYGKYLDRALNPSPKAATPDPEKRFRLISAQDFERTGQQFVAKGAVHFQYKDFDVRAESAEGDLELEVFRLKGNISVVSKDLNLTGDEGILYAKDKRFSFQRARGSVTSQKLGPPARGDLYFRGSGDGTEQKFSLTDSGASTCDLHDPHWELKARSIDIRPGDVVVMRNASLSILGLKLFTIPYLSLPLVESLPRYLPDVGSSPDEGYYVKTRFGLDTRGKDLLDGRVDLMTRLGIGLGGDLTYGFGKLLAYSILGSQQSLTTNWNHTQKFGSANVSAGADYSQRNYLTSPNTTRFSLRNTINWPGLRFAFQRSTQRSGFFTSQNQATNLNLTRSGKTWNFTSDVNFNQSLTRSTAGSGFENRREVVDVRVRGSQRWDELDLDLLYNRSIPVGEVVGFFSSGDETPTVNLTSTSKRIWGMRTDLPLKLSFGNMVDPIKRTPIQRFVFETSLPNQSFKSGALSVGGSSRFRQAMYSDDTAQFVWSYDVNGEYRFGERSAIRARYGYLRPQGFTPLSMDRQSRNDLMTVDLEARLPGSQLFAMGSGYDFLDRPLKTTPWQTVTFRHEWTPLEKIGTKLYATYDPNQQVWQSLRLDGQYRTGSQRYAMGIRYDGQRSKFGAINLLAEGMQFGRVGLSMLLAWNGYTERFDAQQYEVRYDLHCAEAILYWQENQSGFRNGRYIGISLRLKALPFSTPFGNGPRGQSFGGVGGIGF